MVNADVRLSGQQIVDVVLEGVQRTHDLAVEKGQREKQQQRRRDEARLAHHAHGARARLRGGDFRLQALGHDVTELREPFQNGILPRAILLAIHQRDGAREILLTGRRERLIFEGTEGRGFGQRVVEEPRLIPGDPQRLELLHGLGAVAVARDFRLEVLAPAQVTSGGESAHVGGESVGPLTQLVEGQQRRREGRFRRRLRVDKLALGSVRQVPAAQQGHGDEEDQRVRSFDAHERGRAGSTGAATS